ncbi:MAG TPA: ankyrin repeat domain-containing protein [Luteolibacter sp.]|nr:ankyrin repeat domain-containing protein [Luteolibacter sp.]
MLKLLGRIRTVWILMAVLLASPAACRKPSEAGKSDLKEAGYALTVEDWMRAASHDDLAALKKFLVAGFEVSATDAAGNTALHAAAAAGAQQSADLLLDRGLAIDTRGALARTPLMSAVIAGQTEMTAWLLRQGADPRLKDEAGYNALMLAVREDSNAALAELAPHHRDALDSALLLAALSGRTAAIDTLTSYGASVYTRMDDGRTPLMLAAENGHTEAVELLLDIGSSRFSTDQDGRSAADLADSAGHAEIAAMILETSLSDEFVIESPEEIALAMDSYVEASQASVGSAEAGVPQQADTTTPEPARPIEGATLSAAVAPAETVSATSSDAMPVPPVVMRHYRQRELPVEVRGVSDDDTATIAILGPETRELKVRAGETIPGSNLVVVRVRQRVLDSKLDLGRPGEVSVVEVRDATTGVNRAWITGLPATAHDPVALVEDAATGRRYTATAGQKFRSEDGSEFIVTDVRPNQLVIENTATGAVRTLTLRGPRG